MERNEKTSSILRQFRKRSKRIINKNLFTEFFYLNKERRVVEFLSDDQNEKKLLLENFFKKFLPKDFRYFVNLKLLNESEEEIESWFYDIENAVIVIEVNWGFKKQEISLDLDIENFYITIIDGKNSVIRDIDFILFNDFIISFLTNQAKSLAQTFDNLIDKKERDK